MNLALCHGSSKSKERVRFKESKSMIFMYLVQGRSKASNIHKRKQTYKNQAKTKHACRELDLAKQRSGPLCPHHSTNQSQKKQLKMRMKQQGYATRSSQQLFLECSLMTESCMASNSSFSASTHPHFSVQLPLPTLLLVLAPFSLQSYSC